MTSAQVVETSVTNNSSFQNYPHPHDHTIRITSGMFSNWKMRTLKILANVIFFFSLSHPRAFPHVAQLRSTPENSKPCSMGF